MKRSLVAWLAAFVITAASAYFQRVTGPTYPVSGSCAIGDTVIGFTFERSHSSSSHAIVRLAVPDTLVAGQLVWRRFGTDDPWTREELVREGTGLTGTLPAQPPAGKIEYRVMLRRGEESAVLPADAPVVVRFKGDVPPAVLVSHIALMFAGMLFSTRAGLTLLTREERTGFLIAMTILCLGAGGLVLGPVVQKYAFGAFWTGWPFGTDLTDNKTVAALAAWTAAALMRRRVRHPRLWAAAAAVITLAVYMIPHSLFGSQLDYGRTRRGDGTPAVSVIFLRSQGTHERAPDRRRHL